jgi:membrane fusion protein, multidrug efflux system
MTGRRTSALALMIVIAAALIARAVFERVSNSKATEKAARELSVLPVEVISPAPGPAKRSIVLPGTVRAWQEAPIFAQVSGYVQSWNEDYGASVKAGQALAEISTPSLDAQYAAAKANLEVADANYKLAQATAARWLALAGTPAVAAQTVDAQVAEAAARKADRAAAAQVVARYAALEGFKQVIAPFDGVVTARLAEVGAYVDAAGGDAGARDNSTELFSVADVQKMRVFVAVPQDYAAALVPESTAQLRLPSQPGHPIEATFLTTSRSFNPSTRTAVTELTVGNADHSLWPGTYVDVAFEVPTDPGILVVPEQALIFQSAGTQLAVLDAQNRVHLKDVTLGYNLGRTVQITTGLAAGDRIVNSPPAGLLEGQIVLPQGPGINPPAEPDRGGPKAADAHNGAKGS